MDRAAKLRGFTIGYVKSAEKHPEVDRPQVCLVQTDASVKQIICGTPNACEKITVVIYKTNLSDFAQGKCP